ncbi:sugar transferase [Paracoccus luteus]|uniref:sugar transferase n=1 Tax=Paracoccus luteus TaxID=2508543 RepID=UPI00106FF687|nr:sugar transferase [Paracoccus luteus]
MKRIGTMDGAELEAVAAAADQSPADGFYARRAKRVLDVSAVVAALPFVLPLIAILSLAILLGGGKPFYTQLRAGRNGRSFRLFKMRTMVPDADAALERHLDRNPAARAEWNRDQKLKSDPRITRVGALLRKSSLDELPQLFNVLIGDMSLVGPRPMLLSQAKLYPGTDYYRLRPGVTGMWQVSDRNDSAFAQRATFDAQYAAQLSFMTDIRIMFRTVGVVLRCTGY